MTDSLQLGLVGLGTVGAGVYETLTRHHQLLEARAQISYQIKRIAVRDLSRPRSVAIDEGMLTDDWREIVADPDIDIIIELIGGTTEAFELAKAALHAGKPLVTGNKALLAEKGAILFALSAELNVPLYFEASCGGGIPIIQCLQNSLICNHINSIAGIINGTSNYILSSMQEKGMSFASALQKAQELGFAESDPTLDINGGDAAHKALILAMLAYGQPIDPEHIAVTGIEGVEATDFEFAQKLGYTIKLLVMVKHHENSNKLELRVQPSFIPLTHLLAHVNGVFNAISVCGDIVGESIFYGRGAGKNPTSSAVIGDTVLAMRECRHPEFHTGFSPYAENLQLMPADETTTPYYVRFRIKDEAGGIAALATIFTKFGISISATNSSQSPEQEGTEEQWNDLVFILHSCPWGQMRQALEEVAALSGIAPNPSIFRIENFGN